MKLHVTSSLRARTWILFARRTPYWWRSKCLPMARISLRTLGVATALALATTFAFGQGAAPNADGWVVLPVSEYAALPHAAFPADVEAAPPAVEATLSRLDYDLKVDGDLASGEARLTVDVIREGWVRVPLPDGLMVRDAKLVPLLRPGFNPSGAYTVSFVYLSSGAHFEKNGAYEMALPKLDIPVNLLTWEVSLPDRLEVKQFGGNALAAELFPAAAANNFVADGIDDFNEKDALAWSDNGIDMDKMEAGQVGGIVVDPVGAVVAGARVTVTNKQTGSSQTTTSDAEGHWVVSNVQAGPTTVRIDQSGFKSAQQELPLNGRAVKLGTTLEVGTVSETVTVTAGGLASGERDNRRLEDQARKAQQAQLNAPSANVFNLQRRVAGILPVHVDVPRSGKSYRFVRPLVMDEETKISFQYKAK